VNTARWLAVIAAWLALIPLGIQGVRYTRKWWRSRRPIEPGVWIIDPADPPPEVRKRARVRFIEWNTRD
jgi:hypothetical protein